MPSARADEFRRAATKLGFVRAHQTGSHERWRHPDGRATTIPIHAWSRREGIRSTPVAPFGVQGLAGFPLAGCRANAMCRGLSSPSPNLV
ncbi:MAG: type II toxin-antitoxin system HicA family toxin [Acidobacteria bacterium]|nr:type II toxin-antitoxin system HicA family toxin [Acidobacteriota bacterium]